jgi:hypothetical protein
MTTRHLIEKALQDVNSLIHTPREGSITKLMNDIRLAKFPVIAAPFYGKCNLNHTLSLHNYLLEKYEICLRFAKVATKENVDKETFESILLGEYQDVLKELMIVRVELQELQGILIRQQTRQMEEAAVG